MQQLILVAACLAVLLGGCRGGDPRCQRTIGMLRAEKLELENEYYRLKSEYDRAMAQLGPSGLGQPYTAPGVIYESTDDSIDSFDETSLDDLYIDEPEIIEGKPVDPAQQNDSTGNIQTPAEGEGLLARFIQSLEVNQLQQANLRNGIQLLVRPLDERGDIIPIPGEMKVRVFERVANTRQAIGQWVLNRDRVAAMTTDHQDQQPGIHLNLPWRPDFEKGKRLFLDLQYRTDDRRLIRRQLPLLRDKQDSGDEEVDSLDVLVELGEESDSGVDLQWDEQSQTADHRSARGDVIKRPRWKPSR